MKIRLKTTFKSIEEARKALCQCDSCSECPSGALGKAITPNYSRMNEQFFVTIRSTVPLNKHYNCIVLDRLVTRNEFKTLSQMNPTDFQSIVKTSGYLNAYWLKTTLKDFD